MFNVQCADCIAGVSRSTQHAALNTISMTYEFIPLLPLVSFLILGLFGHWIKGIAHLVAVPAVLVSWLLSLLVFFDVAGGRTGLDQALDRALDVEGTRPEAGVDVNQQRGVVEGLVRSGWSAGFPEKG
jgi:hypothetical protein